MQNDKPRRQEKSITNIQIGMSDAGEFLIRTYIENNNVRAIQTVSFDSETAEFIRDYIAKQIGENND